MPVLGQQHEPSSRPVKPGAHPSWILSPCPRRQVWRWAPSPETAGAGTQRRPGTNAPPVSLAGADPKAPLRGAWPILGGPSRGQGCVDSVRTANAGEGWREPCGSTDKISCGGEGVGARRGAVLAVPFTADTERNASATRPKQSCSAPLPRHRIQWCCRPCWRAEIVGGDLGGYRDTGQEI